MDYGHDDFGNGLCNVEKSREFKWYCVFIT